MTDEVRFEERMLKLQDLLATPSVLCTCATITNGLGLRNEKLINFLRMVSTASVVWCDVCVQLKFRILISYFVYMSLELGVYTSLMVSERKRSRLYCVLMIVFFQL